MNNSDGIYAISLFSGCGGLDIGSHQAGIPVVFAVDFDEDSVKTMQKNDIFKNTKILHDDVRNISTDEYKKELNKIKPRKVVLIGGPPCQPFSKAGYWIGNNVRKKDKDPRNMVDEYLRVLKELKPDGFLFENVESLFHPTNKHVIDNIQKFLEFEGFNYKIIKANALDYGVPQKRKRIFIIGTRKKFKTDEPKKTHAPIDVHKDIGLKPYVTAGEAISKFDKKKYFEPAEVVESGKYTKELREVPPGKNYIALSASAGHPNPRFTAGTRFWNFLLKLDKNQPSWTIAAQPGPWVGPFHWTSRRLRVPEIAALQTFPEDYKFHGQRRSIQKQIGNAVPPSMGKAMMLFLKENL